MKTIELLEDAQCSTNDCVERARCLALEIHKGQKYGDYPYIHHLELVHNTAVQFIGYIKKEERYNIMISSYLHDVIEDSNITIEEITLVTNVTIAEIVYCVTNVNVLQRDVRNRLTYIKIGSNPLAVYVKLCDRLVNGNFSMVNDRNKYERYSKEYPIFRQMLYSAGQYPLLWEALDRTFGFVKIDNLQ